MKNLSIKRLMLPMAFLLLVAAGTAWGDVVNIGDASFENAVLTPVGTATLMAGRHVFKAPDVPSEPRPGPTVTMPFWLATAPASTTRVPQIGVQAVALQDASGAHGEISQVLTGLNKGGSVTFTFDAAGRRLPGPK